MATIAKAKALVSVLAVTTLGACLGGGGGTDDKTTLLGGDGIAAR